MLCVAQLWRFTHLDEKIIVRHAVVAKPFNNLSDMNNVKRLGDASIEPDERVLPISYQKAYI
jgi:hypothetical protein